MNCLSKKTVWFEMEENETPEQCIERIEKLGYKPIMRKEEPVFQYIDGEVTYFRQKVKFKAVLQKDENEN